MVNRKYFTWFHRWFHHRSFTTQTAIHPGGGPAILAPTMLRSVRVGPFEARAMAAFPFRFLSLFIEMQCAMSVVLGGQVSWGCQVVCVDGLQIDVAPCPGNIVPSPTILRKAVLSRRIAFGWAPTHVERRNRSSRSYSSFIFVNKLSWTSGH